MVYTSSRSASNDENRLSFQNTTHGSSRMHTTREAARRINHSTPVVHHSVMTRAQFVDVVDEPSTHSSSLPRELRRPRYRPIATAAIAAIAPDLQQVPVAFILREIHGMGKEMYATARQTVTRSPKGRLPREMDVVINNGPTPPPTHLIAVYSQASGMQKQRVSLHPIHGLVMATNCALLPPLPRSEPHVSDYPGCMTSLPVIPLALKSPETFSMLVEYLYTQNSDSLLRSMLPIAGFGDIPPPAKLSRELGQSCAPITLQVHLYRIHGLWSNITALGVFDDGLWRLMELAWKVLQDALA